MSAEPRRKVQDALKWKTAQWRIPKGRFLKFKVSICFECIIFLVLSKGFIGAGPIQKENYTKRTLVPPETQYMPKLLFTFFFFGQFFVHQTFCQILMSSCGLEIRRLQFPILWLIFHEFLLLIIVWLLSLYRPSFRWTAFYLGLIDNKQHPAKTESRIINVFCTMYLTSWVLISNCWFYPKQED